MMKPSYARFILEDNLVPAFGCTDPITPALAAAIAYREANKGDMKHIKLVVSNDVYKGSYSVIIPGTQEKGLAFAVALGIVCGSPDEGLMVLKNCKNSDIKKANQLLKTTQIEVLTDQGKARVYVELTIITSNGSAKVIFNGRHDQYSYLEVNGMEQNRSIIKEQKTQSNIIEEIPTDISDLCKLVELFTKDDLKFIDVGIKMNLKASKAGLFGNYGMGIGKAIEQSLSKELQQVLISSKIYACAAGDARMGGCKLPVMTVFGSGNQGALIYNTISSIGNIYKIEKTRILRAIALSAFLAGTFNKELEAGSPFCKCAIVASSVSAAGIVYLLKGKPFQIENAIQMTISSLAGLLCDGAKPNCALKVSLGAGTATENALISLSTESPIDADGILGVTYLNSLKNLSKIGKDIKTTVEQNIVDIINAK